MGKEQLSRGGPQLEREEVVEMLELLLVREDEQDSLSLELSLSLLMLEGLAGLLKAPAAAAANLCRAHIVCDDSTPRSSTSQQPVLVSPGEDVARMHRSSDGLA